MAIAFSFVVEELRGYLSPDRLRTRAMFGSHGVYVDEKIVFMLRQKGDRDDGIWVALSGVEHAPSMVKEFPSMRPIEMFEQRAFGDWVNLPVSEDGFEEAALELCRLVGKRDSRIGKVPKGRKKKR